MYGVQFPELWYLSTFSMHIAENGTLYCMLYSVKNEPPVFIYVIHNDKPYSC